jgi:hypothetical protein
MQHLEGPLVWCLSSIVSELGLVQGVPNSCYCPLKATSVVFPPRPVGICLKVCGGLITCFRRGDGGSAIACDDF